jgi:glucosyl-3-phosphoglycerate synthase
MTAPSRHSSASDLLPAPDPQMRAAVVIPARDEADRIGACLQALIEQQQLTWPQFEVIVVLDGCRDDTLERIREVAAGAAGFALHTIELAQAQGVGVARRIGMDCAHERLLALATPGGLIASTDADTVVASDWLAVQLELVARGARAIGGEIALHQGEADALPAGILDQRRRRAAERMQAVVAAATGSRPALTEHHHFSGASMSLTAQTYSDCGGLPERAALEDEALEYELNQLRIPIERSKAVRVRTSARTDGRAQRGLARDLAHASWRARRSYAASEFPLARLLEAKHATIALVLPTREVEATIGPIAARAQRLHDAGLLDEVLVVDAASSDDTVSIATAAGLAVVQENELSPELGPARGKGDAMWRAVRELESDIVAFADTDSDDFGEPFLTGLLGPLICDDDVSFVKGFFQRPFRTQDTLLAHGGGRVTELLARPLLNLHAPELAVFDQPLAGEVAARRTLLEQIPFAAGYGVEIAMLIDVWRRVGLDSLAQVDLGARQNRHQSLRDLSAMAYEVLVAAQSRFSADGFTTTQACATILLPALRGEADSETRHVTIDERPPLAQLAQHRPATLPPGSTEALSA